MKRLVKKEFFKELFEEDAFFDLLEGFSYVGERFDHPCSVVGLDTLTSVYSIRLVPDYIQLVPRVKGNLNLKIIQQENWGYAINLNGFQNVEAYLESQFKSKYRSIIRRFVKRLELCFPIKYNLFYGAITTSEYQFIMDSLWMMISRRFQQRNETHKEFSRWKKILAETRYLILNKKASLFVIFNGEYPVQISLNYHIGKILFSAISSYDIDYSKFGLGHVEIYKQLDWCIQNDHLLYEMGVGGMDYKRRWSNTIYRYQHYVIHPSRTISIAMRALIEITRIIIKEYLKSKKVNDLVSRIKHSLLSKKKQEELIATDYVISKEVLSFSPSDYKRIDWENTEFQGLKRPLYDFLYTTSEHVSTVTVWQSNKNNNHFLLKGISSIYGLEINTKGA